MPIAIQCSCGKTLRAREEQAGRRVKCPHCGAPLLIPAATSPAPPGGAGDSDTDFPEAGAAAAVRPAAAPPPADPDPAGAPATDEDREDAPAAAGGFLGGMKAKVQATVQAGKEEAQRQARRAQIALEVSEKKKELEEVYARIGEKVFEDPELRALVNMEDVLGQIEKLDAELRVAEDEAEEIRRRLE